MGRIHAKFFTDEVRDRSFQFE